MADVAERAHQNLGDFARFLARLDPGSELLDGSGVVAVSGTVDFPASRMGIRVTPTAPAGPAADALTAFFGGRGKSSCVFCRVGADDDLRDELVSRSYHEWSQSPEMVCDHPLESRDPPAGVTLRWAD